MKTINVIGFGADTDGKYEITSFVPGVLRSKMVLKRVPKVLLPLNPGKPLQLWRLRVEGHTRNDFWFALATLWFNARALASQHFGVPFESIKLELFDEGKTPGPVQGYVVCAGEIAGTRLLYATGDQGREGLVRGEGLREWEPLALEGGREVAGVPGRVQEDGQGADHAEAVGPQEDHP